jgi:CheY-like chemotaxis protein
MFGDNNDMSMNRILILDDDTKTGNGYDTYLTLKTVLENNGFKVDSYNDPIKALQKLADGLYDLLLVDIKMSYMNDFDLYQKIIKMNNLLKVYLLSSGIIHNELIRNELSREEERKYCSILRKPIENEDLIGLLNTIVNQLSD